MRQPVRFVIVGCSNTLLSWCIFALLERLGGQYLVASGIAWTLGALNSYVLNRRWTFGSRGRCAPELARVGAVQCAWLGLDVVLLDALTRHWAFAGLGREPQWPA